MSFANQKESILKFYDETHRIIDQNKETYGKLVNKLNEKVGLTQTLTNNLDDFMVYSFPDFNDFRNNIRSQSLEDSSIEYVYDVNKNDFVTNFNLPFKNIIIKHNFKCVLMGNFQNVFQQNDRTQITKIEKQTSSFTYRTNILKKDNVLETMQIGNYIKSCNCRTGCNCKSTKAQLETTNINMFHNSIITKKKETKDLEIWIDDYFNLYIPSLKTYLVFNYSKFPIYSFYINLDKLNIYHNYIEDTIRTIQFNEDCNEDLKTFNNFKEFIDNKQDYFTSQDKRDHYKKIFPKILDFYQYYDKHKYFSQFQILSEKLEQLVPSASSKVTVEDEDTMNDDKKIFSQSQRIRELEISNQKKLEEIEYLRTERSKFIENDNNFNTKLSDYQKLLEELNSQLHDEIDKTSIKQKEIIRLKTINLECNEINNRYTKQQEINKSIKSQLNDTISKLSELKTLNGTLIDKQMESQQKLKLERTKCSEYKEESTKLKLDIEDYKNKVMQLETNIESEKEQNILSIKKIDQLINDMKASENVINDQYQEILLSQLKEKNEEIDRINLNNERLVKENQNNLKQFEIFKSQLSNLVKG
jgi:hypothetical protein